VLPAERAELLAERLARVCRGEVRGEHRDGRGWVERDDVARVDHPGAHLDAGDVPIADSTHGHEEPGRARVETALIGMRHHGGVEQRSALDRVLLGEVGPDQLPSCARDVTDAHEPVLEQPRVRGPRRRQVAVAVPEGVERGGESVGHLVLGQSEHPLEDGARPRLAGGRHLLSGQEGQADHACGVRAKHLPRTPHP
jgi:hypothetical protein